MSLLIMQLVVTVADTWTTHQSAKVAGSMERPASGWVGNYERA